MSEISYMPCLSLVAEYTSTFYVLYLTADTSIVHLHVSVISCLPCGDSLYHVIPCGDSRYYHLVKCGR